MEEEILRLNAEINSLTALNRQLELSQDKQRAQEKESITTSVKSHGKQQKAFGHLQTGRNGEWLKWDIAFIFLSQNNVFVQTFQNQQYTINISLEELIKQLDNDEFYRPTDRL